jgi:hypothetical protein
MEDELLGNIVGYSMLNEYKVEASGIHKIAQIKNTPLMVMKS